MNRIYILFTVYIPAWLQSMEFPGLPEEQLYPLEYAAIIARGMFSA